MSPDTAGLQRLMEPPVTLISGRVFQAARPGGGRLGEFVIRNYVSCRAP